MTAPASALTEFHHPVTFASRGVAVPFTTPMLAGARVRASMRGGIEFVVPNPSGARGVYVLHWPGVRALCHPTLHDTLLYRRLLRLPTLDPATLREAALGVALDGHAGQAATAAAEAATGQDRAQRLQTHFLLLTGLVTQLDPNGQRTATSLMEQMADLDRRVSAVLQSIAPALGRPAADLAADLAAIGAAFASVGGAVAGRDARIPRLLLRLKETRSDLTRWLNSDPENDIGGLGRAVAGAVGMACDSGDAMLAKVRAALIDPVRLLKRWIADETVPRALAARCDWLLDGWERVCLLWLSASPTASRRAALLEMASLLPVLPHEVTGWTDTPIHARALEQACRVTSHEDVWRRGGAMFGLIERNEKLLAMRV